MIPVGFVFDMFYLSGKKSALKKKVYSNQNGYCDG
jgi:hypothetical protein